jgi:hypothetical protein
MIFLDAMNRRTPIQLDWIQSTEAFLAVLKVHFRDNGLSKIEAGEYAIQATKTQKDINLDRPWNATFFPGQSYDMSMTFRDMTDWQTQSCPRCQWECQGDSSHDTTW